MKLHLKDGSVFEGTPFGAKKDAHGEVVFNTGMVGYVESLTDPSYTGQILVCTYPLVGNYGVPKREYFESKKIHIAGLVVSEYSATHSHHAARESLSEWLMRNGTPAIEGVDTRALTKHLRETGVMQGHLSAINRPKKWIEDRGTHPVREVSSTKREVFGRGAVKIVLIDCGAKENIVRSLVARGVTVIRVPWNYDVTRERCHGILVSNGPGDPTACTETIDILKRVMQKGTPILGICLGNQLLALAAGASTYKLPYGHRSHNQPCVDTRTRRCYMTSQNHGYAVNERTLPRGWRAWFTNANDGSNEGIEHVDKPWRSVQFHPEASPGPVDTGWIFDEFIEQLKRRI